MSEKTQKAIEKVCQGLADFLIEKNRKYGDSALSPVNIFSKATPEDGLLVRTDDKIKRIMNSDKLRKNDCVDLCGYLILVMIANEWYDMEDIIE